MKKLKLREIKQPKVKDLINEYIDACEPDRNRIERFLDRHNHLMEFIRTLLAMVVLGLQLYILTRLI